MTKKVGPVVKIYEDYMSHGSQVVHVQKLNFLLYVLAVPVTLSSLFHVGVFLMARLFQAFLSM